MIGKTVSHYRVIEKLGSGGMGIVYKARDNKLDRYVALKFLPHHLTSSEEEKNRFIHEAKTASSLDHNNICAIHEIDETEDGQLFISMGYYEGETLESKIKDERLEIKDVLDYVIQIARGLQNAHEKEIVHRDIKPANIMINSDGIAKILDFGLAKLASQTKLTKAGTTLGTVAYMSPEQARGEMVDHRTDIWSFGIILYEMLANELPFKGEYEQAMLYSIINEDPEYVGKIRDDISPALEEIVAKALYKNPEKRFQNMLELCEALENVLSDLTSGLSKTVSVYRLGRRQRRILVRIMPFLIILLSTLVYFVFIREAMATPVSIVLLPLEDITRDTEQEWFTDGMTDALITDLARISGLRIIARSSAMKYKGAGKSASEIARELGVSYVIEGSVVKLNEQVKITTRLIDVASDEYLWVQEYERNFTDILSLQGEVAKEIAEQIKVKLTPHEKSLLSTQRTVNPEAHEAFLKGKFYLYKLTKQSLEIALQYCERAVELDPNYALAYAGIALVWGGRAQMGYVSMQVAREKCLPAAAKALELDSTLADVHYMNAVLYAWGEWKWGKAVASFEKAISLNPNMAEAKAYYSHVLFFLNQPEKARSHMDNALELDPFSPLYRALYAMTLNFDHRYDKAIILLQNTLKTTPGDPIALSTLRTIYHQKKMYKEAINIWRRSFENRDDQTSIEALEQGYAEGGYPLALQRVAESKIEQSSSKYISPWPIATLYTRAGMGEEALNWLEKALVAHDPNMPYLNVDPIFDYLREEPRFKELIIKIGF